MEKLTVSLEMAKKLQAAGWENETFAQWEYQQYDPSKNNTYVIYDSIDPGATHYPAPTAQELADQLPTGLSTGRVAPDDDLYYAKRGERHFEADTMADALATLWLEIAGQK